MFNHSLVNSPKNRSSSTPNSSPDTSPKKKDDKQVPETSSQSEGGDLMRKTIVIVPSGQTVKETPAPSSVEKESDKSNNNISNTESIPMETEDLPLTEEQGGENPTGGNQGLVSHEDIELSAEENRAGHYTSTQEQNKCNTEEASNSSVPQDTQQQSEINQTSEANQDNQASEPNTTSLSTDSASASGLDGHEPGGSDTQMSGASSVDKCDTKLGHEDNLSNSNNLGNSNVGNSDNNNVDKSPSRPDSLPVDDFNSFTYWRDPLPEIDIDADLSPNSQQAAIQAAVEAKAAAEAAAQSSTTSETNDENIDAAAKAIEILSMNGGASDPGEENTVHVASVSTMEEETVTNIGSTHVLGQHLSESTMTVINGVVKGKLQRVLNIPPFGTCVLRPSETIIIISIVWCLKQRRKTQCLVLWNYFDSLADVDLVKGT